MKPNKIAEKLRKHKFRQIGTINKGGSTYFKKSFVIIRISSHMPSTKKHVHLWWKPYQGKEYDRQKTLEFLELVKTIKMTKINDYYDMLEKHDWYHAWSDSYEVDSAGADNYKKLSTIAQESPEHEALLEAFGDHHFSGEPFGKPKISKPERPIICKSVAELKKLKELKPNRILVIE